MTTTLSDVRPSCWILLMAAVALGCGGGGTKAPAADASEGGVSDGPVEASEAIDRAPADAPGGPDAGDGDAGLAGSDGGTTTDGFAAADGAAPSIGPLDPAVCSAAWSVVYSSQANEATPGINDLAWKDGTLFVAHSAQTEYSWVFSIPERGGPKNLLYEGRLAAYWLEAEWLLYAQAFDLFAMPQVGGPPFSILRYGSPPPYIGTGSDMGWRMLDRTAAYWVASSFSDSWDVRRHLRSGGDDTTLASIPRARWATCTRFWMKQADGRVVFGCWGGGIPLAATISKTSGAISYLPEPPAHATRPLTVSNDGRVLWVVQENMQSEDGFLGQSASFSWALGSVAGTPAEDFPTTFPASIDPLQIWSAGGGGWYATAAEKDAGGTAFLSVWYVDAAGRAARLACDSASARPAPPGGPLTTEGRVTDAVAADGAFYLSVAYQESTTAAHWSVVRVENPGASADRGDVGGVEGAPVGGVGGAGGAAGSGCGPAGGAGGAGVVEFAIPTTGARPSSIVAGPDGNLWFGESGVTQIGRITPAGCITEFWTGNYTPIDLTVGPDGNLWFASRIPASLSGHIARMATNGEPIRGFPLLRGSSDPSAIIAGPDGNLWFTQGSPSTIARMTPAGAITEFPSPANIYTTPTSLVAGPDGKVWFCARSWPRIGRIDPATGTMTDLAVPDGATPFNMTRGADGNIWFVDWASSIGYRVVRVTPAGTFTVFRAPASTTFQDVTTTADGNVWLTTYDSNSIVRLTPSTGTFTTYPIPTAASFPTAITTGPDGNVWFAESVGNKIGRVTP